MQPVKLEVQYEAHSRKWSHMIYYIICFPLLPLFFMEIKTPGLVNYTFNTNPPYQKEISVQAGENLLGISKWELWITLQCDLQCSLIISHPTQPFTRWFPFFWFLYIDKHNVKQGQFKGDRKQLRNFKHKGEHKIGCFPKSFLVLTVYQVQGWCTMILRLVKSQLYGSNVIEIILKIS